MVDIGKQLSEHFRKKGVTQEEIARKLGVSKSYVNSLFTGKRAFGQKQAEKWSELFGLSVVFLRTGEGEIEKSDNNKNNNLDALLDTIKTLQDVINAKNETLAIVTEENSRLKAEIERLKKYQ